MSKKPKPVRADMLRKMEADARAIGGLIQEGIDDANHHYGFGLLLFSFDGSELTWISNARREDMIRLFEEMLASLPHRYLGENRSSYQPSSDIDSGYWD